MKRSNLLLQSNSFAFFITGLTDADGTFYINKTNNQLIFSLVAYDCPSNRKLFEEIQKFLGVGKIYKSQNYIRLVVSSKKENQIIQEHFKNSPLQSHKLLNFLIWSKALDLLINKKIKTLEEKKEIERLKSILNKPYTEEFKKNFPYLELLDRYKKEKESRDLNSYWLAGLMEGDGSFSVGLSEKGSLKTTVGISQNLVDLELLKKIKEKFFNIGNLTIYKNAGHYKISNKKEIFSKILPFFNKYPLYGEKGENYKNFKEIFKLIEVPLEKGEIKLKYKKEYKNKIKEIILNSNSYNRKKN